VGIFLDKACSAFGLVVEGLGVLGLGKGRYRFRVGHGGQSLFYRPYLFNVMKFGLFSFKTNTFLKEKDCIFTNLKLKESGQ